MAAEVLDDGPVRSLWFVAVRLTPYMVLAASPERVTLVVEPLVGDTDCEGGHPLPVQLSV